MRGYGRSVGISLDWCYLPWSLLTSTGYDTILLGNFYAYPTFARKYGTFYSSLNGGAGGYQLTAAWQAGLSDGSGVGAFFGAIMNGCKMTNVSNVLSHIPP